MNYEVRIESEDRIHHTAVARFTNLGDAYLYAKLLRGRDGLDEFEIAVWQLGSKGGERYRLVRPCDDCSPPREEPHITMASLVG